VPPLPRPVHEHERPLTAADLDVDHLGTGPPVVLVHGSIVDARRNKASICL